MSFLPINRAEMDALGWGSPDFVFVTGDAYVDHPSFCAALIARVLEHMGGYKVAILAQPKWDNKNHFKKFGRPRLGFLVASGNIDSMVAHYTAAKKKRSYDYYSPGGKTGYRPDRSCIVYCNMIRQAYGDVPIILGGIEASLRRFAHYDYWGDNVRRSILVDSRADMLIYGMGEKSSLRIAELLDKGVPVKKIRDVRGTAFVCEGDYKPQYESVCCGDYNVLKTDKAAYARAFKLQYEQVDYVTGLAVTETYDGRQLVQNPPMPPLSRVELDEVYGIPFERTYHPSYKEAGGIPAIEEVRFSITHNRGCFGGCAFCALAFHQGRYVTSRSIESVVAEAELIASFPDFKGYIHDVGGPTANFRHPSCKEQADKGMCKNRRCLTPTPCPKLVCDHSEYITLLEKVQKVKGVKKVFIRSGIRFDYIMHDKSRRFFEKLVRDHVSGQLKVAPEHISENVLRIMGKPSNKVYERFREEYFRLSEKYGKEQYIVPYLLSSHPGSRLDDAIELSEYLIDCGYSPEQVQDFYPTPSTASTCMYYTGLDPFTGKKVYIPRDYEEKQMQRALLQPKNPKNAPLIKKALQKANRQDLFRKYRVR